MVAATLPLHFRRNAVAQHLTHLREVAAAMRLAAAIPPASGLAHLPSPRAQRMMRAARRGAW